MPAALPESEEGMEAVIVASTNVEASGHIV